MQLKQLKLAGFKSFVDPTVIPFSSPLVAVVGPNGCGKSNIIDAVRWVMGEGSAKTLRGESMADVIFNGASDRKPVGQASVELVFDNHLGRFAGQFASYQEIAIKRLVTRDGESSYFLNGARCRRRDITDLFLGTGAGTRGYSIIGQNTISQIVEAKPEDLRAFLEEAAGVSQYKSRRRETLQRMTQTRDNLDRVKDIARELESQLVRLERQAKAALAYQSLKQAERQCKRDILTLKWRDLRDTQAQKRLALGQIALTYEAQQACIAHATKTMTLLEQQLLEAQDGFQSTQTQYHQVEHAMVRLQEAAQQQLRERLRLETDCQQVKADIQQLASQLSQDDVARQLGQEEYLALQQQRDALTGTFEPQKQQLQVHLQHLSHLNQQSQALQSAFHQSQREVHAQTLNQQYQQKRYQDTMLRLEAIQAERLDSAVLIDDAILQALHQQHVIAEEAATSARSHQQALIQEGLALDVQLKNIEVQLRSAQDNAQAVRVEHATLQASLQGTLGSTHPARTSGSRCLLELLHVEERYRRICEWALGDALHAMTLTSLDAIMPSMNEWAGQSIAWVTETTTMQESSEFPRLSDKITGYQPAWLHALDQIWIADSLEEAQSWCPKLTTGQSIMTVDGFWLGVGWVRVADFSGDDETSILLRQAQLVAHHAALQVIEVQVDELLLTRNTFHARQAAHHQQSQMAQMACIETQEVLQAAHAQYRQQKQDQAQISRHLQRLQEEQEGLQALLEDLVTEKMDVDAALMAAVTQCSAQEAQWQQGLMAKNEQDDVIAVFRTHMDDAKTRLDATALQCSRAQLKGEQLSDAMRRDQSRIDTQRERLLALEAQHQHLMIPDETAQARLTQHITQHQELEVVLRQTREQIDALQHQLREMQQSKLSSEQALKQTQSQMISLQLEEQSMQSRIEVLQESLAELDLDQNTHAQDDALESGMTVSNREAALRNIEEKIKRLGAINLLAIEEYRIDLERKTHLDAQFQDLHDALMTLESAITRMDEETNTRLQATFVQVNHLFQVLFPRLFGGGHARLQPTCDNLLEAGLLVMAQPPGKRNSSIHSLSGGEKAMTAVALIFAIFQLNPSPFCMLDEVDAPLDDLNVGRFCDLVKEMSQSVQFLLITHNKVTMALAEHLIGVTMREPGVSRLVTVDVAKELSSV